MVVLDPNCLYVRPKGKIIKTSPEFYASKIDQVTPYCMDRFGFDAANSTYFNGTVFRFPFRTAETAPRSKISDTIYTMEKVQYLINSFKKEAPNMLLFLKHVESVKLFMWLPGEKEPSLAYSIKLLELTDATRQQRQIMLKYISAGPEKGKFLNDLPQDLKTTIFEIQIEETGNSSNNNNNNDERRIVNWIVHILFWWLSYHLYRLQAVWTLLEAMLIV